MKDSVNALFDVMLGKEDKRQGITEDLRTRISYISAAQFYIASSRQPVNATDERVYKQAQDKIAMVLNRVNNFYNTTWKDYRAMMEKINLSPFKEYEMLKP